MTRLATLALFSAAGLALAAPAYAGGFYLQEQGVRGTGRAYSGEVADTGVESLWWNPAAIARSGREAYVGVHGVFVDGRVDNKGSTITLPGATGPVTLPIGGEPIAYNPVQKGVLPNFDIAMPIGERFAVGFSAHAPFDFQSLYQSAAWTRYDALKSRLTTIDLQFTGAMKVTDWLDVGVSADAQYTDANLTNALPNLSPLLPDGFSQLKGDAWNWGWAVGAQAHFDRLTLGVSYRSFVDHELSGQVIVSGLLGPLAAANLDVPGKAKFRTPWIAAVGARYRLTDKLTLNAQVQRIGWSGFKNIEVVTAAGGQLIPENYRDVTSGGVGLDYEVSPALTLRAGAQYDPTPTPGAGRSARVPDGNRWLIGAGASARITPAMTFDAAFAYIDFQSSQINRQDLFYAGTPAAVTTNLNGRVEGRGLLLSLGLRSSF
jgi:long-chain fatty acid transport protein